MGLGGLQSLYTFQIEPHNYGFAFIVNVLTVDLKYLYETIGTTKEGKVIRRVDVLDLLIGQVFASQPTDAKAPAEQPADGKNPH